MSRQTHEIGIRLALGASTSYVLMVVLRLGLMLVGIAVGLLASTATTLLIANQLWGVTPYDPVTLTAVIAVVLVARLAACYFPARRAMRVDPTQACATNESLRLQPLPVQRHGEVN